VARGEKPRSPTIRVERPAALANRSRGRTGGVLFRPRWKEEIACAFLRWGPEVPHGLPPVLSLGKESRFKMVEAG
jgi:hypothetical protein